MKVLIIFSLVVAAVTALPGSNVVPVREALGINLIKSPFLRVLIYFFIGFSPRIISGKPAALGQFPWQVANKYATFSGTYFCGGALVNSRWVLTAGHCADGAFYFEITLGSLYSDGTYQSQSKIIGTTKAVIHPAYNSLYLLNDVALINLNTNIQITSYIKPIPLETAYLGSGVSLTVSGWGKTSDASNSISRSLNFVKLTSISNSQCKSVYGITITEGTLCCVGSPQHSTCSGDSGGPLIRLNANGTANHVGVVSFVHKAGCASGNPSGYSRTQFFRSWIINTINVLPVKEALKFSSRIISGKPATLGQFPWQVSNKLTTFFGRSFCGGALIGANWVLTAAHCADGALYFDITLGALYSDGRYEPQAKVVKTDTAIIHPLYSSIFLVNDLALIQLKTNIEFTDYIQPIPLSKEYLPSGISLTVSGWGKTSDSSGTVSSVLNFVSLTTISNGKCKSIYGLSITDGTLCCVGAPEQSTCNGDSGGPLIHFGQNGIAYHAGVVSFVHIDGCASGNPSGYTHLSPRIISGEPAKLGQFPWQVINKFTTFLGTAFCGGALIKTRWVLTAGHCAEDASDFTITLGSLYSDGRPESQSLRVKTKKSVVHPDYSSYFLTNDLALIDLITDVVLSDYIKLVPLGTEQLGSGVSVVVSGWGKTSDSSNVVSQILNFVKLTTTSNTICKSVYGASVTDGTLCCLGAPQHSTCNGDSGGPLVQIDADGKAHHVGVVSFVHIQGCASGNPSGYARTQHYVDWILSTAN
ncbi:hypothetical protein RN001_013776 [Aquatica leii]|uniref:Peptidase S1 domain-containing protein n=1 Tax=Aquatica leii TaxID=1421715 RepID=A0AAN7P4W6_9COLE|nr:hypothetical protein RN001_013776 [Aquatica leii]